MPDQSNTSAPFTETELNQLWATFGGDLRFQPLQNSHAMRLSAFENAARVVAEVRRLRTGGWIEAAAREIACSPQCGDVASSSATAIASVIRRHLSGGA
jgi:hypothetical protein